MKQRELEKEIEQYEEAMNQFEEQHGYRLDKKIEEVFNSEQKPLGIIPLLHNMESVNNTAIEVVEKHKPQI